MRTAYQDGPIAEFAPGVQSGSGVLIINADDWGLDRNTTDRILECAAERRVSTVSAMVFMEDSERAAELSRAEGVYAGLHLNLTTPFSAPKCASALRARQQEIAAWLRGHRFSRALFHPGLRRAFEYVVSSQFDEFERLYGAPPTRIDGHHHMHLSPNVLLAGLLPAHATVRRNFSFQRSEKSYVNRLYRSVIDRVLARRYQVTDYFFSLAPLSPPSRLSEIFSLARTCSVEVETHPAVPDEHRFLMSRTMAEMIAHIRLAIPQTTRNSGSH
jgi:predicted glycoside hydrolase/deacetylase ChbG (UPF0249 family)